MFEKVCEIISKELGIDKNKIQLESELQNDLGADSLDAVSLIMDIEEEFGVSVDDDTAKAIKTVGDIVKFLENK